MSTSVRRQVIFVGGTSYSGSTFFHMILGNDPKGSAVGELRLLVNPRPSQRVDRPCSCGDETCDLWRRVRSVGQDRIFKALFSMHPKMDFIVDSSKSVYWIARQSAILSAAGVGTRQILIWKSPQEIYSSMKRRGREDGWHSVWANYHQLYFSLIPNWRAVQYSQLVTQPEVLRAVCDWLGIPYFEGKERYWEKQQHIFGGNRTSRFHLYSGAAAEQEIQETFDADRMRFHRKIYYSTPDAQNVHLDELLSKRQLSRVQSVVSALLDRDVCNPDVTNSNAPEMAKPLVLARGLKYDLDNAYGRWMSWLGYSSS